MAEHISFGGTVTLGANQLNNVVEFTPPPIERQFTDTTNHSNNDRWTSQRPTLISGGDCEITMQQDSTNTGYIVDILESDTATVCYVVLANGESYWFDCYVKSFVSEAQTIDGISMSKLTLAVTGFVSIDGEVS